MLPKKEDYNLDSELDYCICDSRGMMVICEDLPEFMLLTNEQVIWLAVMQVG
jgi:hypothetical protein